MFDDDKERDQEEDDLQVQPDEVEDLDASEKESEDVEGGRPRDPRQPLTSGSCTESPCAPTAFCR